MPSYRRINSSDFHPQVSPSPQDKCALTQPLHLPPQENNANQQHVRDEQNIRADNSNNHQNITRVDGNGLWRSWKRNFTSKLLAILDLVDNSLDASIGEEDKEFIGRCHVFQDTTSICIFNNSHGPIRPLCNALEVYDSSKIDSGADKVGENGVGLKQACATLSDLSFVLVKNGSDERLELGLIAEKLQRAEGCYLPAFQFSYANIDGPSLQEQMLSIFSQPSHSHVASCIAQYGGFSDEGQIDFVSGVNRLCNDFKRLCTFHDNPYVFAVILDRIHYGGSLEIANGPRSDWYFRGSAGKLLSELVDDLPRRYLHVPESFDFRVNDKIIEFKHWPKRLVEFSSFSIKVGTTVPFYKKDATDSNEYSLRVFVGFDSIAMSCKDEKTQGALFLYSRRLGRLITIHDDARILLSLTSGGSDFSSGMRVIIDDFLGYLPLNPTKQDIAFSEQVHGDIHRENLYNSVGAIAHLYYKFHLNKCDGRKTVLTQKIVEFGSIMQEPDLDVKNVDNCQLTTFDFKMKARKDKHHNRWILRADVAKYPPYQRVGSDTLYRLLPDEPQIPAAMGAMGGNETLSPYFPVSRMRDNTGGVAKSQDGGSTRLRTMQPPAPLLRHRYKMHPRSESSDEDESAERENFGAQTAIKTAHLSVQCVTLIDGETVPTIVQSGSTNQTCHFPQRLLYTNTTRSCPSLYAAETTSSMLDEATVKEERVADDVENNSGFLLPQPVPSEHESINESNMALLDSFRMEFDGELEDPEATLPPTATQTISTVKLETYVYSGLHIKKDESDSEIEVLESKGTNHYKGLCDDLTAKLSKRKRESKTQEEQIKQMNAQVTDLRNIVMQRDQVIRKLQERVYQLENQLEQSNNMGARMHAL